MIIKNKRENRKTPTNFYKYYFLSTIIIFFITVHAFSHLAIWQNYKNEFLYRIHNNGMVNYKYLPQIFFHAIQKIKYSYETIYVNINQRNKIILEKNRLDKINYLDSVSLSYDYGAIDFVSARASITNKDKIIKTNIRLKGDRDIHYRNIKNSSYKFNLRDDKTFWGMRKFSLQKPRIRNYLNEWIFHELMSEGDLIKLKYNFVYFNLNGENMGLYNLEEGFGKELLERNKRRNGPIFSLNEDFNSTDIYDAKFEIYDDKTWLKKENIDIVKKARQNFKDFLDGKIKLDQTFDIKKWAWFFAVVDLTYSYHGILPKSVRFYYNPVNGKFEPIPFDGHRMLPSYSKYIPEFDHSTTFDKSLSDPKKLDKLLKKFFFLDDEKEKINETFYFEYIKAIKKISSKKFLNDFFESRELKIKKINSAIYTDSFIYDYDWRRVPGVGIYYYDKNDIYYRANKLLNKFSPKKTNIFIEEDADNLIIYNTYIHNQNLNLSGIECEVSVGDAVSLKKTSLNINLQYPKHIFNKEKFLTRRNNNCNFLYFTDKINNIEFHKKIDKINGNYQLNNLKKESYRKYFIQKDDNLFLKEKTIEITENLLIPKNYNVIVKSGEKIFLKNNAFIFSESPWQIGEEGEKVFIGGEKNNFGGGLLVFDAKKTSEIKNTNFSYLRGLQNNSGSNNYSDNFINNYQSDFILFGSINFYNSNVEIKNVSFKDIASEDAVNIIKSNYKIDDAEFNEILSDAIDIDFGTGEIINSNFKNIGNDGIDFSGSESTVLNCNFNNIGDKMISIGEVSEVDISNIKGKNSYIGIVSKDGSNAFVKNIQFENVKIPFSAYQKKSEYSFAKMNISNIKSDNYLIDSLIDKKSKIFENNNEIGKFTANILSVITEKN